MKLTFYSEIGEIGGNKILLEAQNTDFFRFLKNLS